MIIPNSILFHDESLILKIPEHEIKSKLYVLIGQDIQLRSDYQKALIFEGYKFISKSPIEYPLNPEYIGKDKNFFIDELSILDNLYRYYFIHSENFNLEGFIEKFNQLPTSHSQQLIDLLNSPFKNLKSQDQVIVQCLMIECIPKIDLILLDDIVEFFSDDLKEWFSSWVNQIKKRIPVIINTNISNLRMNLEVDEIIQLDNNSLKFTQISSIDKISFLTKFLLKETLDEDFCNEFNLNLISIEQNFIQYQTSCLPKKLTEIISKLYRLEISFIEQNYLDIDSSIMNNTEN